MRWSTAATRSTAARRSPARPEDRPRRSRERAGDRARCCAGSNDHGQAGKNDGAARRCRSAACARPRRRRSSPARRHQRKDLHEVSANGSTAARTSGGPGSRERAASHPPVPAGLLIRYARGEAQPAAQPFDVFARQDRHRAILRTAAQAVAEALEPDEMQEQEKASAMPTIHGSIASRRRGPLGDAP